MTANLSHFALNADDVPTAKAFYERVFGWTLTAWGPPGFFRIRTGSDDDPGVDGALQQRRDLVEGQRTIGAECTFAVQDVDAVAAAARRAGGRVAMDRFTISGVGHLVFVEDPSGNVVGALQYDPDAA